MGFLSKVHLSCFLLTYLLAFAVEIYCLLRQRTRVTRWLQISLAVAGLVAHTSYLVSRSANSNLPPLVGSSHDWLLVLAWLGGLMYLLAVATQERLAIGVFLLPMTIGLVAMAVFVDDSAIDADRRLAVYRWGMLHAATLVIGLGSVAAATICGLMYLLQYQKLRGGKSWRHRLQLPSLETLTLLNRWLVVATVAMLTMGLVTGFVLVAITRDGTSGSFRWSDPIVAGTIIVWGIMVATLTWLLTRRDQSGRQVARLTIVAGGFLLLTILGLMLLSGGVHGNAVTDALFQSSSSVAVHPWNVFELIGEIR
ncbi:MAG: cytochrome c biogenesis protein CcsA [Planctomycetaceae bacterium]